MKMIRSEAIKAGNNFLLSISKPQPDVMDFIMDNNTYLALQSLISTAKQVEEVRNWLIGKIKELEPIRNIDTESGILCSCYETFYDMLTENEEE